MDNENTNSPQVEPHLNLTPEETGTPIVEEEVKEVAETPSVNKTTEQPAKEEPKQEEPKPEAKAEENSDTTDIVDDKFIRSALQKRVGEFTSDALVNDCVKQITHIIGDGTSTKQEMAQRCIDYVCDARAEFMIGNTEETLKHFGSDFDTQTPEYNKAVSDANLAINAIEKQAPGFKNMLNVAGIQSSLPVVLAFSKLYPVLGEDGNFMNGGTNAQEAPVSIAHALFGADRYRKE